MTAQPLALAITADPWGTAKDLEELHAEATQAMLDAVAGLSAAVALGQAGPGRPLPLVILGSAGIGKTHLFSRLRRKLGQNAILVHIRPITSADMTPRYVLGQLLQQLARSCGGARQIDSLVGATLALDWDGGPQDSACTLELLRSLDPAGRQGNLEHCLARMLERMPDLDDGYLELLLKAPFLDALSLSATLAWLGGQDISETQAARIGVRQPLAEDRVLPALRTVARMAAVSAPLLLVFDQLENLIQAEGQGRILAYGNLVMDLVDEVRDLVLVQMALETEWQRGIRPVLSLAQQARVLGPSFVLEMPTPQAAEALIRLWMAGHLQPEAAFPWPFTEFEFDQLIHQSATPRMLLQELQRRLEGRASGLEVDGGNGFGPGGLSGIRSEDSGAVLLAEAWEALLGQARAEIDSRDQVEQGPAPETLSDGLIQLVRMVPELRLLGAQGPERVQVQTAGGELRVALIHQAHHRSIASALDRLGQAPGLKLGLREAWRPFKPTWKVARGKLESLLRRSGVAWHWLQRQDAERLLALDLLLKAAVSRDLSGPDGLAFEAAQVEAWVCASLAPRDWAITQALSAGPAALGEVFQVRVGAPPESGSAQDGRGPLGADPSGLALRKLGQLRVASVDRLIRDCRQECKSATRAELLAELSSAGSAVTWIGENIVCLEA